MSACTVRAVSSPHVQGTAEEPLGPGSWVPRRERDKRLAHFTGSRWELAPPIAPDIRPRSLQPGTTREPKAHLPKLQNLCGAHVQPAQAPAHRAAGSRALWG